MNAKEIFDKLISMAVLQSVRLNSLLYTGRKNRGVPGELLGHLTAEEREEIKNLSSKDINDPKTVQRDVIKNIAYCYSENATTVHTHSIKEEEDDRKNI